MGLHLKGSDTTEQLKQQQARFRALNGDVVNVGSLLHSEPCWWDGPRGQRTDKANEGNSAGRPGMLLIHPTNIRVPCGRGKPGGLQSMGSQIVRHD